jgi:cell fate (sporulation/competence/biofilm development) regulator YlbF (YheA/YmcA/DUF963 family)
MNNVEQKIEELITAIRESDVYREYRVQQDIINQVPELKRQIDDYRKRNFALESAQDTDLVRIEEFRAEFKDFRENPVVENYLASELAFCRMMQQSMFHIYESIEFDVD